MNPPASDRTDRQILEVIAENVWPWLALQDERERRRGLAEFATIAYSAPLAALGLGWLVVATDLALLRREWLLLLLALLLALLFEQLPFFQVVEFRSGVYDTYNAHLAVLAWFSAALLFGPTALWIMVVGLLVRYARGMRQSHLPIERWSHARRLLIGLAHTTIGFLLSLAIYQALGGRFPLSGLAPQALLAAAAAILVVFGFTSLLYLLLFLLLHRLDLLIYEVAGIRPFIRFLLAALVVPAVFAILAATLYSQLGLGTYLFLMSGALLTSLLAHRFSVAVERSRQRSRELALLEQLGRALLAGPPDASVLPQALAAWVPEMFRHVQVDIRLFSGQTLLHRPDEAPPQPLAVWDWMRTLTEARCFAIGEHLPWSGETTTNPLAVAPIASVGSAETLGGIVVVLSDQVDSPTHVLPALQSLAAQIATTLYRAEEYVQSLAHQRMMQELAVASEIQASFLPDTLPQIDGWQLAVMLWPARETSGDFYDLLELPGERLGLLVADVTDKGTGAALFMALSRTLIRTYAFEYPADPRAVLRAVNRRILTDTHSGMFVTVFYGVLDPASGRLSYCNAGHNPPYILSPRPDTATQELRNTGIPLGLLEEADWETKTVAIEPGDTLVIYTDGISEAQNERGQMFGAQRLLSVAQDGRDCSADTLRDAILSAVTRFIDGAPQYDDITVMIVARDGAKADVTPAD